MLKYPRVFFIVIVERFIIYLYFGFIYQNTLASALYFALLGVVSDILVIFGDKRIKIRYTCNQFT